jgi:hypothetical protein
VRQLSEHDIRIGQALSFPVYDRDGKLLLEAGYVVRSEQQCESLIARGFVREGEQARGGRGNESLRISAVNPTPSRTWPIKVGAGLMRLREELRSLLPELLLPQPSASGGRLRELAGHLGEYIERDADSALAHMQLSAMDDGPAARPLHAAILVHLVGRGIALPSGELESLVCAALSFDCALAPLSRVLNNQRSELTPDQKRAVRLHPRESLEALQRAGVDDPIWLSAVAHHHERLDGSGYPQGLTGDDIPQGARLLALADTYCAMIRPRAYRGAIAATEAMRTIFLERGSKVDEALAGRFIREVGIYPPGALVRLENNEIAIVWRRGERAGKPTVRCVFDRFGKTEVARPERDTSQPGLGITESLSPERYVGLLNGAERLWD